MTAADSRSGPRDLLLEFVMSESNGKPAKADELARLTAEIKDDLEGAKLAAGTRDKAEWEVYRRRRSAGEGLRAVKRLKEHGEWGDWLKDNFHLKKRQAQRLMRFSKTSPGTLLTDERRLWREAAGKAKKDDAATGAAAGRTGATDNAGQETTEKAKKGKPGKPKLPEDGARELPIGALPKEVADELDGLLMDLVGAWTGSDDDGLGDIAAVVVRAIRFAHEAVCGRKEVALAP